MILADLQALPIAIDYTTMPPVEFLQLLPLALQAASVLYERINGKPLNFTVHQF